MKVGVIGTGVIYPRYWRDLSHANPSATLALAMFRRFSWRKVLSYFPPRWSELFLEPDWVTHSTRRSSIISTARSTSLARMEAYLGYPSPIPALRSLRSMHSETKSFWPHFSFSVFSRSRSSTAKWPFKLARD